MRKLPDTVILIGQNRKSSTVRECLKLGITMITFVDTNCDPSLSDYVIPANDDSEPGVKLLLNILTDSITK